MKTRRLLSIFLLAATCLSLFACSQTPSQQQAARISADDLMKGISARAVEGKPADDSFVSAQNDFAAALFKNSFAEKGGENTLVSPLSVTLALAMTANGAEGQTLSEMEKLLGGDLSIAQLNDYLKYYVSHLSEDEKCKLKIANSIWFRDDASAISVERQFLQTNADYYGAAAYKEPFDGNTVKDINAWVKSKTDGMIDKIIEEIDQETVMFLINALVFDAEWQTWYGDEDVSERTFRAIDGTQQKNKEFMCSDETAYLEYDGAVGFKKNYWNGYSFAAMLPPEGADFGEFVASLDGAKLKSFIGSTRFRQVKAYLPKFDFDFDIELGETLKAMGISTAFDSAAADFSRLGTSQIGNIHIGSVLHKTHIEVDTKGTKAAAVTAVIMNAGGAMLPPEDEVRIVLDRPFVFMILDNNTGLPVFIGALTSI